MDKVEVNIPITCLADCLVNLDNSELKYLIEYVLDGEKEKQTLIQEVLNCIKI